jgi:hypothetical protein
MIETRTQMIKNWIITFLVVALLIVVGKNTVYNVIFKNISFLGVWLTNYLSIFLILAVSVPLIKYIVSMWGNK